MDHETVLTALRHPEWWLDRIVGCTLDPADAVVVTGFWRSGTTWVLQSLARALRAKAVFEPFHYNLDRYRNALLADFQPPLSEDEYLNMYMPYCGCDLSSCSSLQTYLRSSLTGGVTDPWVRGPRMENRRKAGRGSEWKTIEMLYRVREAFRTDVVTKFVRGHLAIPALCETYDPVVVHIRRDPRAVIASFHRLDWTWYKNLSLEDQLLAPNDGRAEYFSQWGEMIQRYEQSDPLVRIGAYWALVERFVADLPECPRRVVVSYEDLCLQPEETLTEKVENKIDGIHAEHFGGTSTTTEERRMETSKRERILGWKDVLPGSIVEAVVRMCKEINLEDTLFRESTSLEKGEPL